MPGLQEVSEGLLEKSISTYHANPPGRTGGCIACGRHAAGRLDNDVCAEQHAGRSGWQRVPRCRQHWRCCEKAWLIGVGDLEGRLVGPNVWWCGEWSEACCKRFAASVADCFDEKISDGRREGRRFRSARKNRLIGLSATSPPLSPPLQIWNGESVK